MIIILMLINSDAWFVYSVSFFTLYPKFNCWEVLPEGFKPIVDGTQEYKDKCNPNYFCHHDDVKSEVVADDPLTLDNYMSEYDLICSSPSQRSIFMMMWALGYAIGCWLVPYFGDNFGRKKTFCASMTL